MAWRDCIFPDRGEARLLGSPRPDKPDYFRKERDMSDCPRAERNAKLCPCTYGGCDKHAVCCECLHYHRRRGELPACYFTSEEEATYDRSVEHFIRNRK